MQVKQRELVTYIRLVELSVLTLVLVTCEDPLLRRQTGSAS